MDCAFLQATLQTPHLAVASRGASFPWANGVRQTTGIGAVRGLTRYLSAYERGSMPPARMLRLLHNQFSGVCMLRKQLSSHISACTQTMMTLHPMHVVAFEAHCLFVSNCGA